jgi:hypothetical protein
VGREAQTPNLVRVLKASHVMYVGCDAGGRNGDHKCGVLLTSRRQGAYLIYLIIFLHLAFGPSKCKDDRVVNEGIQYQVAGDEKSTRIGIYSEFQYKREATFTPSCSLMRRRRERGGWLTGPSSFKESQMAKISSPQKLRNRMCNLQRWLLRGNCQRGKRYR